MEMPRVECAPGVERRISLAFLAGSLFKAIAAACSPLPIGPWDVKAVSSAGRLANHLALHTGNFVALALHGLTPRTYQKIPNAKETPEYSSHSLLKLAKHELLFCGRVLQNPSKTGSVATLAARPAAFSDPEVLTIALLQGVFEVATLKQTYRLVAQNWRTAFPQLPSYKQWLTRVHHLLPQVGRLLVTTCTHACQAARLYLIDSKPTPLCQPIRHGRVR